MHKILRSYLKRLTDLTARNRSLLLYRLTQSQFLDLSETEHEMEKGAFEVIENLIGLRQTRLSSVVDTHDKEANRLSKQLKKLQRLDRFIREERGSDDLYVGWPFVRGKLTNGSHVRCPLLFFPVSLINKGNDWVLKPRSSGAMLNKSFLLAYAYFNDIRLDDEFLDRNLEDFDNDSTVFRTSLYQFFKDSDLEINFNQANFEDHLDAFKEYKKDEFDGAHEDGQLKLFPEAVLGIFPQAGSYLVPDYLKLIENNHIRDIEEFFASRQLETYDLERTVSEERLHTPYKLDAYQENAIQLVKKGQSLVVQGPPGTGKSQLICNLVADHVAVGKTVLVVSQKRAALDVVFKRLNEKDLTDFSSLVHDFRNDRKEIYQKIARQIDRLDEFKMKNSGLDAIQLERNFTQTCRRIDQIKEEFEEYKFALFNEKESGLSAKELYLTSDPYQPAINIKQEYKYFIFGKLDGFLQKLKDYFSYSAEYERVEYPWRSRNSFAHLTIPDQRRILEVLDEIPAYQQKVNERMEKLLGQSLDLDACEAIYKHRDKLVEMLGILKKPEAYEYFQHMVAYPDEETNALWISNTERVMMECFKGVGPETSLKANELGRFQEVLERSMSARKSLVRLLHWSLFSKDKFFIKRVLVENGLKQNKEGFKRMVEKVDNRLNLEHNLTKIRQKEWIKGLPDTYEKGPIQNWFYLIKLVVKAKLIFNGARNLKDLINPQKFDHKDFRTQVENLFTVIKDIHEKFASWYTYLSHQQIVDILKDNNHVEIYKKTLRQDFDALCEFDRIKTDLEPHELQVIEKLKDEKGEDPIDLFQNSLRLAWIEHVEIKYPILRTVSTRKFQSQEAELQNLIQEKMRLSGEMLLLKAREQTYEQIEYNRLNNRVTYRDLNHQVTKKRRVWPLRKLIAEHEDELFRLIPCWLASPEAVSAIFPMREMFDLVIFDEASQCFVERGIPAMYRGRQVVIAGDNKQLRPNDLYQVRFEDETEDQLELEVESLLELANHHLMDVQLKGHYRSKSPELIDFSNRHFYDTNLKLLPDYDVINKKESAIEYIKLEGTWENNTNFVEADHIVNYLHDLAKNKDQRSIGVVTFNARQQQLILDLIDEHFTDLSFPENWFVKNIENVQGDEKDVIIFSTAYAPDKQGKLVMQFGSLNMVNGENRLNVAITRAREKIIVVSSILPNQLRVEETKNEGPKLLKSYLQYAKDVSEGNFEATPPRVEKHHAAWYLKQKLMETDELKGYTINTELPFADLTIKRGDDYLGLVITDDDLYFQGISIKEQHVYLPFTLNKKAWHYKQFYSRQYWNDQETLVAELRRFMQRIGEELSAKT